MNEKIANQLSRIYYYTLGRFIDAACLYKLDLKEYQIKPCTINREQYEFIVTDQYLAGLEDHYNEAKHKIEQAKEKFESGNYICLIYLNRQNQEIAYTRWLCKNEFYSSALHQMLYFNEDEIFTLDSYTKPSYRGHYLHRDMNIEMLNWLKSNQEYRYVYMVIKWFMPYLEKYPKLLGYKKIKTKVHYNKGSIPEFFKLIATKIKKALS